MIKINNIVIHELIKEQHKPIQNSNLREQVLDPKNETVLKLVDGIISLYGKRNNSAHYGTFRSENKGKFPDAFNNYASQEKPNDITFLNLTLLAMESLYGKAESTTAASGGYMLFSDFSNTQGRYFLAAMIKQKEGIKLSAKLEPEELIQLDLNQLHQAARISFGKLSAYLTASEEDKKELNYLSFISPAAGKTTAGYFVTALGCARGTVSARATDTLIKEGVAFFRDKPELNMHRYKFRESLITYLTAKESSGESVKLSEIEKIARQFIPAEQENQADKIADDFISHLNSEKCAVPVEFPVSKKALIKNTHINYMTDNYQLKFDRIALGEDDSAQIFYDREHNRIIIKDIPKTLIEAIDEVLVDKK